MARTDAPAPLHPQKLWDWPVRIVHVGLIFCVGFAWLSYEMDWMDWHVRNGLLMVGLLSFRILWGVVGSTTARFGHFLRAPSAVIAYVRAWRSADARRWVGHNPLGGWAVLVLLLVLVAQATTGLFSTDDILTDGPLRPLVETETAQQLTQIHEIIYFYVILALVGLHVAANVAYRLLKGWDLITPMITGSAPLPEGATADLRFGLWGRFLICAGLSAALVWRITQVGGSSGF